MVLDHDPEDIRSETDLRMVENKLRSAALVLALLGLVDTARDLLDSLEKATAISGPLLKDAGLEFAWNCSGRWPVSRSEPGSSDRLMERLRERDRQSWGGVSAECRTYDEKGLEACLAAADDQFSDEETGHSAMKKSERLVKALEISLRLRANHASLSHEGIDASLTGEMDQLQTSHFGLQSAEILAHIAARWDANQQILCLAATEYLWPYYIRGLLADALKISEKDIQAKGSVLLEAFTDRLKSGHAASPLAGKTVAELLEIGNKNTLRDRGILLEGAEEVTSSTTLFRDAATPADISSLESRLGIGLPEDYKTFLALTDGFGVSGNGVFNGYFPDPELYSVSQVDWDDFEYFQLPVDLLELPRDIQALGPMSTKRSSNEALGFDSATPLFDRVLSVGARDIDNIWLVHPKLVRECQQAYEQMYQRGDAKQKSIVARAMESFAGSKQQFEALEWCCVKWSSGGSATMTSYATFAKYLEDVVVKSGKSG